MKRMTILAALMGCASLAWAGADSIHSLRGGAALDAVSTSPAAGEWYDGDGKIQRNYIQQPPLIPHNIEGFSINRDGNACLSCHNWNSQMPGATKVAVSHFLNRDNEALARISPRRYFCTQCHVPQKQVEPLVGNLFRSLSDE